MDVSTAIISTNISYCISLSYCDVNECYFITLAMSGGKRVLLRSGVCPSVCPVGILTVTHQEAAYDAASVHFGPTIRNIDILVKGAARLLTILTNNDISKLEKLSSIEIRPTALLRYYAHTHWTLTFVLDL